MINLQSGLFASCRRGPVDGLDGKDGAYAIILSLRIHSSLVTNCFSESMEENADEESSSCKRVYFDRGTFCGIGNGGTRG